jgi:hypothetical protein
LLVVGGQENFLVGQGEQIGDRILTLLFPPADYLSNRGINDGGKVHQTPGMLLFSIGSKTYHTRLSSFTALL